MNHLSLITLGASAVAYLWVSSKHVLFELSPSALLAIFSILLSIILSLRAEKTQLSKNFMTMVLVSLTLIWWSMLICTLNGLWLPRRIFQMLLGVGISFAVYLIADNMNAIRRLIKVLIIGATSSAIVGIGQFCSQGIFIDLWTKFQNPSEGAISLVLNKQVAGLAVHPVAFSYHLVAILPLTISMFLLYHSRRFLMRKMFFLLAAVIIFLALLFTGIRAATGGAILSVMFMLVLLKLKKRRLWKQVALASVASVMFYIFVGWFFNPTRFLTTRDVSARVRPFMQLTAIRYALYHPFGTGVYRLSELMVDVDLDDPSLTATIYLNTPHNQFLNVLVYYGFPGLACLLIFYAVILKTLTKSWHIARFLPKEDLSFLVVGLAGAVLGYLLNSIFHNAGPFVGDVFHWYLVGLVFAIHSVLLMELKQKSCNRRNDGKQ